VNFLYAIHYETPGYNYLEFEKTGNNISKK
jgi:hypothetical protein